MTFNEYILPAMCLMSNIFTSCLCSKFVKSTYITFAFLNINNINIVFFLFYKFCLEYFTLFVIGQNKKKIK